MRCWTKANAALETVTAPDFPAEWNAIAKVLDVPPSSWALPGQRAATLEQRGRYAELRAAYNAALADRSPSFGRAWAADERLYAKYKAIAPPRSTPSSSVLTTTPLAILC